MRSLLNYLSQRVALFLSILVISHAGMALIGFVLGIYLLPIIIAPESPSDAHIINSSQNVLYSAEFTEDLDGNDFLHWVKGTISITSTDVVFTGEMAPGPNYKLYLAPEFVANETEFFALKAESTLIGNVNTFDKFIIPISKSVNAEDYKAVVIWCETFKEFIGAAKYQQ